MIDLEPRVIKFDETFIMTECRIDPKDYNAAQLIAQISDGWVTYCTSNRSKPNTVRAHASRIRTLGSFLSSPSDRDWNLETYDISLVERLTEWEKFATNNYTRGTNGAPSAIATVRRAIATYIESTGLKNDTLRRWSESPVRNFINPQAFVPLDEFSNRERIELRDYCRNVVRAGEKLLTLGSNLIDHGPSSPNTLKAQDVVMEALIDLLESADHETGLDGGFVHSQQVWRAISTWIANADYLREHIFGRALYCMLVPSMGHLAALRILIHLDLDVSPDETLYLLRSDVEFQSTSVRLSLTKNRAHRQTVKEIYSIDKPQLGWSAGDLFRRAENAMWFVRKFYPDRPEFWIGSIRMSSKNSRNNSAELPGWIRPMPLVANSARLSTLIKKGKLDISEPYDIRRARKTHKSIRAVKLKTFSAAAGDDHSVEVFRNHYAQSSTVYTLAAQAVSRAQELVMDRIGPVLVLSDTKGILDRGLDNKITAAASAVQKESPTDRKIAISACSDPSSPPHHPEASLCLDAPRQCLTCRNAIFFKDHLPRLLYYRKWVYEQQKELPPAQFAGTYRNLLQNLETIIAHFPENEIISAENNSARLDIPITVIKGPK